MHFPPSFLALLTVLLLPTSILCAEEPPKPSNKPCTLHSPTTGSFYDLRPLELLPSDDDDARSESWHAKGWDYGANFTINFCGPVIEELEDVMDIDETQWRNVSAYYKNAIGDIYSIGQESANPIFRGKKLVLNYTNGSPCPELDEFGDPLLQPRSIFDHDDDLGDDDDDDDDSDKDPDHADPSPPKRPSSSKPLNRRKSTLISFSCDRDPLLTDHPQISFIGSPDHCSYFFEVRSRYACGGTIASGESGSLGPGAVFAVILAIALLVYLIGGCAYQRTVMHQRGWRQCPQYDVWAGICGFVCDMFIILFSSCTSRMPSVNRLFNKRGGGSDYHVVGTNGNSPNGGHFGRGRRRNEDDENRLIDQLDEEWDD